MHHTRFLRSPSKVDEDLEPRSQEKEVYEYEGLRPGLTRKRRKDGTASISNDSDISARFSASI